MSEQRIIGVTSIAQRLSELRDDCVRGRPFSKLHATEAIDPTIAELTRLAATNAEQEREIGRLRAENETAISGNKILADGIEKIAETLKAVLERHEDALRVSNILSASMCSHLMAHVEKAKALASSTPEQEKAQ